MPSQLFIIVLIDILLSIFVWWWEGKDYDDIEYKI